jgi:hypothetical protein
MKDVIEKVISEDYTPEKHNKLIMDKLHELEKILKCGINFPCEECVLDDGVGCVISRCEITIDRFKDQKDKI